MSPSLPACARWPLRRLPAPEPRAEAPATPRSSPRRWSRPAPRTPAYLVPSEPRASMPALARHWPRLRRETPSWARGGSGPRGGEAGWAVDPPRRLIWARGGEARGEGAAAGVSAFRGRRSGKAARAAQSRREERGAAGPGPGRGCRPALRPHSWRRPSRGPGARSAPPPSRRLLARVTPAEPGRAAGRRPGPALLLERPGRGAGARPGSRGADRRPDASLPPDAACCPAAALPLPPHRRRGPWRGGRWDPRAGEAPRTVVERPPPRAAECPHWRWPSGNRGTVAGVEVGVGWSHLRPGGSSGISSAEESAPLTPLTQPRSWTRPGPARHCGPRGPSGRDSACTLPGQRLCSMSPREELLMATSPGRGPHPAPSLWSPPPGLGRRILICAQVRKCVHSNTWV